MTATGRCSRHTSRTMTASCCRSDPPNSTATSPLGRTRSSPSASPSKRPSHSAFRCCRRCEKGPGGGAWGETCRWPPVAGGTRRKATKPLSPQQIHRQAPPAELRRLTVDGSFGGSYERPDEEVLELWRTGVAEVRDLIENGWNKNG